MGEVFDSYLMCLSSVTSDFFPEQEKRWVVGGDRVPFLVEVSASDCNYRGETTRDRWEDTTC